jgi:hypothetical protein
LSHTHDLHQVRSSMLPFPALDTTADLPSVSSYLQLHTRLTLPVTFPPSRLLAFLDCSATSFHPRLSVSSSSPALRIGPVLRLSPPPPFLLFRPILCLVLFSSFALAFKRSRWIVNGFPLSFLSSCSDMSIALRPQNCRRWRRHGFDTLEAQEKVYSKGSKKQRQGRASQRDDAKVKKYVYVKMVGAVG